MFPIAHHGPRGHDRCGSGGPRRAAGAQTVSFPVQGTVRTAAGIPVRGPGSVAETRDGRRAGSSCGCRRPHVLHVRIRPASRSHREIDVTGPVDNLDMVLRTSSASRRK